MSSFREILQAARDRVDEVDPERAEELLNAGWLALDVREHDEYAQGAILDSLHIPRGQLETSVETQIPDRSRPVVAICASGVRSALAAATLADLGYENVVSMEGGFDRWKEQDRPWSRPRTLAPEQRNRYQRHLLVPGVGETGQLSLLQSKVLVLGAGGLGSPASLYLAAAGVGTLGIVDMDAVDESNLQRQILHNVDRVGDRKVDSAKRTITALNPDVDVVAYDTRLGADNVLDIMSGYDVVVDGADNFPSRYLVNDASVKLGIPVVHGSVHRFEGQVSVFDPRRGPTYRDMLPRPPSPEFAPNCADAGVLGVVPGIIGTIQALETIKLILGVGEPLIGRLLVLDALEMTISEFRLRVDPSNPVTWEKRDQVRVVDLDGLCAPRLDG